ncbi:unnamed protein product [Knipowitschia caucasica]
MAQVKLEQTPREDSVNLNLAQNQDLNLKQDPDCGDVESFILPFVKTEPEEFYIPAFQESSAFYQSIKQENESSDCDTDDSEDCSSDSSLEETHKCSKCWKVFGSSLGLKIHNLKMHKDMGPLSCPVCGKTFKHERSKLHHLKYTVCAKQYKKMTQPLHTVTQGKPDNCPLCLKVKNQCIECGERFTSQYDLTLHQRIHEVLPFHCSFCSKGFCQIGSLELHARTHTGKWPFLCSICGKGFVRLGNLKQHVENHKTKSGNGSETSAHLDFLQQQVMKPHLHLTCPLCPKVDQPESRLQRHMGNDQQEDRQKHMDNHKKRTYSACGEKLNFETLKCQFCSEEFPKMILLKRHMQTHIMAKTPEEKQKGTKKTRAIKSTVCSLELENRTELMTHVETHSGEKQLLCRVCGRTFKTSGTLLLHMRAKHHSSTGDGKLGAEGKGSVDFLTNDPVISRLNIMDSFPPSEKPRVPLCSGWRVVLTRLSTRLLTYS